MDSPEVELWLTQWRAKRDTYRTSLAQQFSPLLEFQSPIPTLASRMHDKETAVQLALRAEPIRAILQTPGHSIETGSPIPLTSHKRTCEDLFGKTSGNFLEII